jgi:sucrose-6-phosphate hydrolase SacC (GH32 family)
MHDLHTEALLAWWSFDEGQGRHAEDRVSGRRDPIAYVFNQARYKPSSDPLWRPGIDTGQALLFDGYSTWVTRAADQMPRPEDALTIAAWVAPASFEHGDEGRLSAIVDQHDREERQGYILGVFRHGAWSLQLGAGGDWLELWAEAQPLPRGHWSYIVAIYDGAGGRMALSLNGELVAERAVPAGQSITACHHDLLIGKNNKGARLQGVFAANMFHGLIDEVSIHRRALTLDEIRANYAAYREGFAGGLAPTPDLRPHRSRYDGDRHRPQYHFIPPEHWMNEPHAPLHFRGRYHLFYQHNPQGPYWHQIHWGHAVSDDLVHWRDLPYALSPEQDAVDPDGCWSGSAVVDDDGVPAIFYSAGDNRRSPNQAVALARSTVAEDGDADLSAWVKHPQPLVVQEPGIGLFGQFRDPFVWREDGGWHMLVGSGIPGQGGAALLYRSDDMLNWTYRGPLYAGDVQKYPRTGDVWELPVFLPLGCDAQGRQKHILLINPWFAGPSPYYCKYIFYWIGAWDREHDRFIPDDEPQVIDLGEHFIGPSATIDAHGRIVLFSIVRSGLSAQQEYDLGWANNGGLPVVLNLRADGRLGVEPIPELRSLRAEHLLSIREQSREEANRQLQDIRGTMLEVLIELEPGTADRYGLAVRRSPDGMEETLLFYDAATSTLNADRQRSSMDPDMEKSIVGGTLDLRGEHLRLRIYLDHSMVEAYANELKSLTTRVYPVRRDALGLQVWGDGTLTVKSMDVWRLRSAYGEAGQS